MFHRPGEAGEYHTHHRRIMARPFAGVLRRGATRGKPAPWLRAQRRPQTTRGDFLICQLTDAVFRVQAARRCRLGAENYLLPKSVIAAEMRRRGGRAKSARPAIRIWPICIDANGYT